MRWEVSVHLVGKKYSELQWGLEGKSLLLDVVEQREKDYIGVIHTKERLNAGNQSALNLPLFADYAVSLLTFSCQGGRIGLIGVSLSHARPIALLSALRSPSMPAPWRPCWCQLTTLVP